MQSIYQVQSEKYVTVDALDKRYEIQAMLSFDFFCSQPFYLPHASTLFEPILDSCIF